MTLLIHEGSLWLWAPRIKSASKTEALRKSLRILMYSWRQFFHSLFSGVLKDFLASSLNNTLLQNSYRICRPYYYFWIKKSHHLKDFWIKKSVGPFFQILDPETAVFLLFLGTKIAPFLQYLDPKILWSIFIISGSRNHSIF